jgi:uncharacterized protein YaiI (UPF0178 family)
MLDLLVDADGCPVKDEIYRVARRYALRAWVVSNKRMFVPEETGIEAVVVGSAFDAADDWIVEHAGPGDIVITADLLLAQRAIQVGARVLGHKGRELDEDSIGDAVATRELLAGLREMGQSTGGPAAMTASDRSRFLGKLDELVHRIRKAPPAR